MLNRFRMFRFHLILIGYLFLTSVINAKQFEPLGNGLQTNGEISGIEFDSINNRLYVAGSFTNIGGIACNNIAMYDGNNWHNLNNGFIGGYVSCLKCHNGNLYVGGSFDSVGGVIVKNIAMWDGINWNPVGSTPVTYYTVMDLAIMHNELYLTAFLTNNGNPTNGMSKWNGTNWQTIAETDQNTRVLKMLNLKDSILLSGYFKSVNGVSMNMAMYNGNVFKNYSYSNPNNFTIPNPVLFNDSIFMISDNTVLKKWNGLQWTHVYTYTNDALNLFVYNDSLYVNLHSNNGLKISLEIWQHYPGGLLKKIVENSYSIFGTTIFSSFTAFCQYHNSLLIGGSFTNLNSKDIVSIGSYENNTIKEFAGVAITYDSFTSDPCVYSMAFDSINNMLYVAGSFHFAGDSLAHNVAQWDGISWKPMGNGLSNLVRKLIIYKGILYAGGDFLRSGDTIVNGFAKWDGINWRPVGNGCNGSINSMVIHKNKLYIAGNFTSFDNQSIQYIAKYNGVIFTSVNNNRLNQVVSSLATNGDSLFALSINQFILSSLSSNIAYISGSQWNILHTSLLQNPNEIFICNDTVYVSTQQYSLITNHQSDCIFKYSNNQWTDTGFSDPVALGTKMFNIQNEICVGSNYGTYTYKNGIWNKIFAEFAFDVCKLDSINYFVGGFFPYAINGNEVLNLHNIGKVAFTVPNIEFTKSNDTICDHQYVSFKPNFPFLTSNFEWQFPNGIPSTSIDQFPLVKYNSPGDYNVALKITNAFGVDSILKTNCIHVDNCIIGIEEIQKTNKINIFPNPTSEFFTVGSNSEIYELFVYNISGQIVYSKILKTNVYSEIVNCHSWERGLYFVKIHNELGYSINKIALQ